MTARAGAPAGAKRTASFSGDSAPEPMVSSRWMPEATKIASMPAASAPFRSVRSESPTARIRRPPDGGAADRLGGPLGRVVGIGVRLAGPEHLAVHAFVEVGDGACANVLPPAHVDDEIGVGAHERQTQRAGALQHLAVVVGGFGAVVVEPGAQDRLRRLERHGTRGKAGEGGGVAIGGTDRIEARVALLGDVRQRDLAGGDDVVVGVVRHVTQIQHGGHALLRNRGIGDEDHRAAAAAEAL